MIAVVYRTEHQYNYPSVTKGGALEVEVTDFASTNEMSLPEFGGSVIPKILKQIKKHLHASR